MMMPARSPTKRSRTAVPGIYFTVSCEVMALMSSKIFSAVMLFLSLGRLSGSGDFLSVTTTCGTGGTASSAKAGRRGRQATQMAIEASSRLRRLRNGVCMDRILRSDQSD